jgi:hypothetical protein
LAEQQTLNLRVEGSIPSWLTKPSSALSQGAKYLKNGAVAAVRLNRFPSNAKPSGKNSCWSSGFWFSDAYTHRSEHAANALCERQDAFYIEFFDGIGVTATIFFSRPFSCSTCRSRFTSAGSNVPNRFRQA